MAPGNTREFNCFWEHCGKSFSRKSDLCRHYRVHTNERPYHCTVKDCNKSFIQRSALTVHSRTHTGEKPHICDHEGCHRAFSDSSSLARHRRIHSRRHPYVCKEPNCERSFCRKESLTKHQHRTHPRGTVTRPPSEKPISEELYQPSINASVSNAAPQQPDYYHLSSQIKDFHEHQNVPIAMAGAQEASTIAVYSGHAILPPEVQHVQQECLQQFMLQRYRQGGLGYAPSVFQQPYSSVLVVEGYPLMVTSPQVFQAKQGQTRLLSKPEGTDWEFLSGDNPRPANRGRQAYTELNLIDGVSEALVSSQLWFDLRREY